MARFIPKEKLSKKARKQLDSQKRTTWAFSPTTRKVESKKQYDRKKHSRAWTNGDEDAFLFRQKLSRKPFSFVWWKNQQSKECLVVLLVP